MANGFLVPGQQRSTLQDVGLGLRAFSAGVRGQGQQFLEGERTQEQALSAERMKAAADDVFRVQQLLGKNDLIGVRNLAESRLSAINKVRGDTTETQQLLSLTNAAIGGDQQSLSRLKTDIDEDLQAAVRGGFIQLPQAGAPLSPEAKLEADRRAGRLPKDFVSPEKAAKDAEIKVKADKLAFEQTDKLISNARKDKRIDNFIQLQSSMDRIQAANQDPTGASDVSMIFSFMKMLDPGSVVRESEFQLASDTAGAPEFVKAAAQKLISGERLTDVSRANFITEADKIFERSRKTADKALVPIQNRAKKNNLDFDQIRQAIFGVPVEQGTEDLTTLTLDQLIAKREALRNQ